jgi:hypothetical protein
MPNVTGVLIAARPAALTHVDLIHHRQNARQGPSTQFGLLSQIIGGGRSVCWMTRGRIMQGETQTRSRF